MFQWNITLSDKQVIMLAAFHAATDDSNNCRFHAVHAMVGDAWDVRAVRKLQEAGLINVAVTEEKRNRWNITEKGECIARAIQCDAISLGKMSAREGLKARSEINRIDHQHWVEKQKSKRKSK